MDIVKRLLTDHWITFTKNVQLKSEAADEIVLLRKALEPFAEKYLWPDDSGYADQLRADEDWSEVGNDDTLDSCWIQRKWIRDAREALRVMDIVDRLRTVDISWSQEGEWCAEAADEIIKLREALLDTVRYISRIDYLFLKESTTDLLKEIPNEHS